jgi:glutaminyl-tRNA synthetase
LCDIGFKNHRPLYKWYIEELGIFPSRQIEFGRQNISYTITSKRYLKQLIEENLVAGWDDPRLPTLCGLRRRGYTPESIREFCVRTGVSKSDSTADIQFLEHCLREHLNKTAPRAMAVLDPLKVVITNYDGTKEEDLEAINNPEDESFGTRKVPFCREIYIEREDFMEDPPRKFFRLAPGREVRLRYAYLMTCEKVIKDENGEITELRCMIDPESRGGNAPDGRKVKGTIHWVSARHGVKAEVRLYEYLFTRENPLDTEGGKDWKEYINPDSLAVLKNCILEPSLSSPEAGYICQFERKGYFCADPDSADEKPVFNRTVSLKDSWKRMQNKQK